MKKIFSVLALLLSLALILTGCGSKLIENLDEKNIIGSSTTENDVNKQDYKLYLENDKLQLYINPDTTEFKVVNLTDNSVWYSTNPNNTDPEKKALLYLEYVVSGGVKSFINSYNGAVKNGQYKIKTDKDKVTISYSIGDFSSLALVPEILSKERYKELSDKFDDPFEAARFRNYYTFFDASTFSEEDVYIQDTMKKYSILQKKTMYVVSNTVLTQASIKKDFAKLLAEIGYNKEDFEKDSVYFKDASTTIDEAGFNVSIELSLDGSDLIARIPNDSIEMYSDFPLTNLTLLKYFGSQTPNDTGYFVLPDGSGSVMNIYNGKTDGHQYSCRVYGMGYSLSDGEKTSDYNNASLPIFGINSGNKAIFAEITEGDAIADVRAYSGDSNEYSFAAPCFRFRESFVSRLSSGRKEQFNTIQKKRFPGDMSVRYSFLTGEQSSYNGMASFYRNRLFGDKKTTNKDISLMVEYIGMLQKQSQLFGISYEKKLPMTTYDQVSQYSKDLVENGISNLNIKMSGWFGDGYTHSSTKNVSPIRKLGGSKGFNNLVKSLNDINVKFWPDADVQYTVASGLEANTKAIRTISKSIGSVYYYDLASFNQRFDFSVKRRVNTLDVVIDELNYFTDYAKKNSLTNISLRSMGQGLNADFNEDNFVDHQLTIKTTIEQLKKLKNQEISFLTSGANAYMFNLSDMFLNVPLTSNEYDSTNYSIPFLQMVLRGKVDYAGTPMNLTGDTTNAVLRAAQSGANLYYLFGSENTDEIVESDYTDFYSIDYSYYKDYLIKTAKKYQSDFKDTVNQEIVSYIELESGVSKTVFANGSTVYVNLNNFDVTVENISLTAKTYIVKKG